MTIKRGNNEGSIHKLPNGHWRGQVSHEGHRLSKVFKTQRECQDWIRKTQNQIDGGMTYDSTQLSLNVYMKDWLAKSKTNLRQTTWTHYEQLNSSYISVFLGKIKLKDLRAEHIDGFYTRLLENGVGIPTIRKIHALVHRALQQAVKIRSISNNPASLVDPPRKPNQEMMVLTESEISHLQITVKGHRLEALIHLAIVTGMRESELLGLKWTDLDWVRKSLKIERQLARPDGNGVKFMPPKTNYGKRSITLGKITLEVLQEHNERQQKERLAAGEAWQEYGLIFTTSIGTPIHQRNLQRYFKTLLKQAGLPSIRFHDLRHTAASLMLNHGVPVIVVSRRLGHARASITTDTYGHLLPDMQDEAAEMIDGLVTPTEVKLENFAFKA